MDTIVRVEAGKLRKRLEEYYADEGAAAPVRIEVPKGSYVPQFLLAAPTPASVVPASAVPNAPVLKVRVQTPGGWGETLIASAQEPEAAA